MMPYMKLIGYAPRPVCFGKSLAAREGTALPFQANKTYVEDPLVKIGNRSAQKILVLETSQKRMTRVNFFDGNYTTSPSYRNACMTPGV